MGYRNFYLIGIISSDTFDSSSIRNFPAALFLLLFLPTFFVTTTKLYAEILLLPPTPRFALLAISIIQRGFGWASWQSLPRTQVKIPAEGDEFCFIIASLEDVLCITFCQFPIAVDNR